MTAALDWPAINEIAGLVGRVTARQWPGIDAEDCQQEALTALVEAPQILERHGDNPALIRGVMNRAAARYASRERYAYTVMTGVYLYTPREIRDLLEHAYFDPCVRGSVPEGDETKTALLVWENVCLALWDMDAAWERLSADDAFRLRRRFAEGEEYPTNAARVACDRAVDKLTQLVNERLNAAGD